MIGRTLWFAVLAALAVVASLAQLDRSARSQAALAAQVPSPFRGFAAERLTEQAISAEDGVTALREARLLVKARPMPAENMRLLSQASVLAGDGTRALAAMEAATTRGWRDPLAQLAAGQSALLQGDYAAAAQRIAALSAVGALPDQRNSLLAALLAQPEGRAAFAVQLANPARWRADTLTAALQVVPPEQLAPTLAQAQAKGAALPCELLNKIAAAYRAEQAAQFWPGKCARP